MLTKKTACVCGSRNHALAFTALVFAVPAAVLARDDPLKWLAALVVLTSLWYHGTHLQVARVVDIVTVRVLVLAALLSRRHRNSLLALLAFAGVLAIHKLSCFKQCPGGPVRTNAHAVSHALGAFGLVCVA